LAGAHLRPGFFSLTALARSDRKSWIEAARRRLHQNVLAIALANKLARIAWAVLNKERNFACVKRNLPRPA
jgi:hypothetical protein